MIESSFEKLLEDLSKRGVEYVTVGGVAVSLNGFLRLTEDVDVLIGHSVDNVKKFIDVLSTFGDGHAKELSLEDFALEPGALRIVEQSIGLEVDVFVLMKEKTLEGLSENILFFTSRNGVEIPYLDRQGLIFLKTGSVREKDQIDISALKKLEDQ